VLAIEHEGKSKTTFLKQKELKSQSSKKMIKHCKAGDPACARQASKLKAKDQYVAKLFDILGPTLQTVSGYVRVLKPASVMRLWHYGHHRIR